MLGCCLCQVTVTAEDDVMMSATAEDEMPGTASSVWLLLTKLKTYSAARARDSAEGFTAADGAQVAVGFNSSKATKWTLSVWESEIRKEVTYRKRWVMPCIVAAIR